ncbi:phosphatidate phosphatase PAH1 [Senna tora]|uniref:phosphatidate phosphatase n=1 Tax=Senna tora TaxID=362788 RepID=A0A834TB08_9FABA|nr:phosphatidate phosphatase PAH1 [Senna tora]
MNVVGKVGSLITQGVYSVATPFHPFGGAIDVIVVQQQDGTFRSTPWYVRFGKFQGVLKGAEKFVRIDVNGVEANFHMYLDNSGEAYFIKEVDDDRGIQSHGVSDDSNSEFTQDDSFDDVHHILDHSISDIGILPLKGEDDTFDVPRLQRAESDVEHKYYEFQDDQSYFEDSDELSEFGSNQYENLDGENLVNSQGSLPEVVLVSVDGHILTAPISESEQNKENLQLGNDRLHPGAEEGTDFCEGNEEFNSGENACAADYLSQLEATEGNVQSNSCCPTTDDDNDSGLQLDVSQGKEGHNCQAQETLRNENKDDHLTQIDSEEVASSIKKENVYQSCLELQQCTPHIEHAGLPEQGSSLEVQNVAEDSNADCLEIDGNQQRSTVQSKDIDKSSSGDAASCDCNGRPNLELEIQEVENEALDGEMGKQAPLLENNGNKSDVAEPQAETSCEGDQSHSEFEISLCGHELKAGMGLPAAAEVFEAHRISAEEYKSSAPSIIKNQNLIIRFRGRYLPWEKAAPLVLGNAAFDLDIPIEPNYAIPVEHDDALKSRDNNPGSTSSGRRWKLWPIPFRKVKKLDHTNSNLSIDNEDIFVDSESVFQNSPAAPTGPIPTFSSFNSSHKQFKRTNVPTSKQIASLNLKEGQNLVTFSYSTRVLGKQEVDAHIYLWMWNAKIVISDVDGTITKSDVLGQFMPLVGKDWTQSGVARLFSAIKENGYQLLFLSARAIVQAYLTRSFLLNLKQDGKTLPNGPVVISPDGLFPSLFREGEDIKRLFPSDHNPFYAGFGNRDTDEISYRKIGIPKGKIFIINPKGEVAISHRIDVKSYTSLHTLVNDMFPPTSLVEHEDFNSWNYWKMALPDID